MAYNFVITILFILSLACVYRLLVDRASFKAILKSHGGDLDAFTAKGNFGAVLESKMAYVCDTMCLVDHFWVDSPLLKKLSKPQAEFISAFSKYHHRYVYWLFTSNNKFSSEGEVKINFANLAQLATRAYKSFSADDIDIPIDGTKLGHGDVREMAKLLANILRRLNELQEVVESNDSKASSKFPPITQSNVHSMPNRVVQKAHVERPANTVFPAKKTQTGKSIKLGSVRVVDQAEYERLMQNNSQQDSVPAFPHIPSPVQAQPISDEFLVPIERDDDTAAAYAYFAANCQG